MARTSGNAAIREAAQRMQAEADAIKAAAAAQQDAAAAALESEMNAAALEETARKFESGESPVPPTMVIPEGGESGETEGGEDVKGAIIPTEGGETADPQAGGESGETEGETEGGESGDPVAEVIALAEERATHSAAIAALNGEIGAINERMLDRSLPRDERTSLFDTLDAATEKRDGVVTALADVDGKIAARKGSAEAALSKLRAAIGESGSAYAADVAALVADGAATVDAAALGEGIAALIARARHFNGLARLVGMDSLIVGSVIASAFKPIKSRESGESGGSGSGGNGGSGSTTYTELADGGISFPLPPAQWRHLAEYLPEGAFTVTTYGGHKDARRYKLNAAQRAEALAAIKRAADVTLAGEKLDCLKRWIPRLAGESGKPEGGETAANPQAGGESGGESGK